MELLSLLHSNLSQHWVELKEFNKKTTINRLGDRKGRRRLPHYRQGHVKMRPQLCVAISDEYRKCANLLLALSKTTQGFTSTDIVKHHPYSRCLPL